VPLQGADARSCYLSQAPEGYLGAAAPCTPALGLLCWKWCAVLRPTGMHVLYIHKGNKVGILYRCFFHIYFFISSSPIQTSKRVYLLLVNYWRIITDQDIWLKIKELVSWSSLVLLLIELRNRSSYLAESFRAAIILIWSITICFFLY